MLNKWIIQGVLSLRSSQLKTLHWKKSYFGRGRVEGRDSSGLYVVWVPGLRIPLRRWRKNIEKKGRLCGVLIGRTQRWDFQDDLKGRMLKWMMSLILTTIIRQSHSFFFFRFSLFSFFLSLFCFFKTCVLKHNLLTKGDGNQIFSPKNFRMNVSCFNCPQNCHLLPSPLPRPMK